MRVIQRKITAKLGARTLSVYVDNPTTKTMLYNWMNGYGYPVTSDMSILRLVKILTRSAAATFAYNSGSVMILDAQASFSNSKAYIPNGSSISGTTINLEDV